MGSVWRYTWLQCHFWPGWSLWAIQIPLDQPLSLHPHVTMKNLLHFLTNEGRPSWHLSPKSAEWSHLLIQSSTHLRNTVAWENQGHGLPAQLPVNLTRLHKLCEWHLSQWARQRSDSSLGFTGKIRQTGSNPGEHDGTVETTSTQSITEDIDVRATMSIWPEVREPGAIRSPAPAVHPRYLIDLPHFYGGQRCWNQVARIFNGEFQIQDSMTQGAGHIDGWLFPILVGTNLSGAGCLFTCHLQGVLLQGRHVHDNHKNSCIRRSQMRQTGRGPRNSFAKALSSLGWQWVDHMFFHVVYYLRWWTNSKKPGIPVLPNFKICTAIIK